MTTTNRTPKLNKNQNDLIARLTAQADAAAQNPGAYSRGLMIGGQFCHRATVRSLEKLGLLTVKQTSCGTIVDLA